MRRPLFDIQSFGLDMHYNDVLSDQKAHRACMIEQEKPSRLYLGEHAPTFTIGRGERDPKLRKSIHAFARHGFDVVEIGRGGKTTYHGPGQMVGYPVFQLRSFKMGVKQFVCGLETCMMDYLALWGIEGRRQEGLPGVWVGTDKIGSVGIHVRKGVSMHGFALNLFTNLSHCRLIAPCGIPDQAMTSIQALTGKSQNMKEACVSMERIIRNVFEESLSVHML